MKLLSKIINHSFFWILLFSFLISLLLFVGRIDQDFFSYYYIGRGIVGGLSMFKDFAENKGPVFYFFLACLYKLFGNSYQSALFFSNFLIDTFCIYFLIRVVENFTKFKLNLLKGKYLFLLFFITAFYKSFSISTYMGGLYSENLAVLLIVFSIFLLQRQKSFASGIFFSLAVLSRLTVFFYLPFYVYFYFFYKKELKKLSKFSLGLLPALTLIVFFIYLREGNLTYFIRNFIFSSFTYARGVKNLYYLNLIFRFIIETRILLSFIFCLILFLGFIKKNILIREKFLFFILFIGSTFSSFVGGFFYPHHYMQFVPFFVFSLILFFKQKSQLLTVVLIATIFFVGFNYSSYFSSKNYSRLDKALFFSEQQTTIESKKYLKVVTYYPELYIKYQKNSPDRYFQPFFTSKYFNSQTFFDIQAHQQLEKERLKSTLFLVAQQNKYDEMIGDEYLSNFAIPFKLQKMDTWEIGTFKVDVYVSAI